MCYSRPLCLMLEKCISDPCYARLMASLLLRAYTSEPTSPHVEHGERKEGVGSGERAPINDFLRSTASAKCFPAGRAAFYRLELAQALTMAILSRGVLFLCRGWLSKSFSRFNLPFLSASSLSEGPFVLPYSALAKGSSHGLEEPSIVG